MIEDADRALKCLEDLTDELFDLYQEQRDAGNRSLSASTYDRFQAMDWAVSVLRSYIGYPVGYDFEGDMVCGHCGCLLDKRYGRCPGCGEKVVWDDVGSAS